MQVQRKDKAGSKQAATAGPSADDRNGTIAPTGKPIEGRLIEVTGDDNRPRITIAGGVSRGVVTGMVGYIKDGVDGSLGSFEIEDVEGERSYAHVVVRRDKLRMNAHIVINANPPRSRSAAVRGPARLIGHSVQGKYIAIQIARGSDEGVFVGMKGHLVDADGTKGMSFQVHEVNGRIAFVNLEHTSIDEVRRYPFAVFAPTATPAGSIQRKANGATGTGTDVQATAQAGVAGASASLPHLDTIQRSFGKHDVSSIRAQIGGPAAVAADALGAEAYATGNTVAFAAAPDLHTAAHEAAHVVQQARGAVAVQGLGAADDAHEQHADAVADAVVAGRSAEALLDGTAGGTAAGHAVQRKENADERAMTAAAKGPFVKPMRSVIDWRPGLHERAMPYPAQKLECVIDGAQRAPHPEHPAKPQRSYAPEDTTGAEPAIHATSSQVKATHDGVVDGVNAFRSAERDPALKALLVGPQGGSLAGIAEQQRLPERDGLPLASLFDEDNMLTLDQGTYAEIYRADRARPQTGKAAAVSVEKGEALRVAAHMLSGAAEALRAAKFEVDAAVAEMMKASHGHAAEDIQREMRALAAEAAEFKSASDAAFTVVAGLVHAAAGEAGDMIGKIGELVGTLLARINDGRISQLEVAAVVSERAMRTAEGKALAATLEAGKARSRQALHQLNGARGQILQAMTARSGAYKALGAAAASELGVPATEKRKVEAIIAALPLVEYVAAKARVIAGAIIPGYSEPAGHGLWLAHASGDPRVPAFLRALNEIAGERTRYAHVARKWEHRLAQARMVASSVTSHEVD